MNNSIVVSVITVCYNAESTISETIESVLLQNYDKYEYLVIDGMSSDNTNQIIDKYEIEFNSKDIPFTHISELDNGIFDAMNKAIKICNGSWVIFMNADDSFYSSDVLINIFDQQSNTVRQYDVIYGDTNRISGEVSIIGKGRDIDTITKLMPFCHQSSFTRTELLKQYPFNCMHIVADYELFLKLYLDKRKFYYTKIVISNYSLEGTSNQDKYRTYLDTIDIKDELQIINKKSFICKIKRLYFRMIFENQQKREKGFFLLKAIEKYRVKARLYM